MSKKLYLFPDTNIFLQCIPLSQVIFSEITNCDEVCVIITRPIQQEIDRQKGQGNSRLSKKAKNAASLFSEVVDSPNMTLVIRERSPRVFLTMDLSLKPSDQLSEQLDYQEADDRFVGIAAGYCAADKDHEVAIITNDSGPRFSAIKHNITCYKVPSSWMLAAETDEKDKQIKLLETRLKQLTQSMPEFNIKVADDEQLEVLFPYYTALSEDELSKLLFRLTDAFPLVTDFSKEQANTQSFTSLEKSLKTINGQEYVPVSADEIALYKDIRYPEWQKQCEEMLKICHEHLNPKVIKNPLSFLLRNTGYAIAERAVVTFTAKGEFVLCGNNWKIREIFSESKEIDLPSAPTAPKGKWRSIWSVPENMAFAREIPMSDIISRHYDSLLPHIPAARDKNDFYYKNMSDLPVKAVSLECEEWRHQIEEEEFPLFIYTANKPKEMTGAIEVRVDANNLLNPITKTFKLKINIEEQSAFSVVMKMVHTFIQEQQSKKQLSLSEPLKN
ncbi:DNA-binding protein [Rahnella aceris]|uniref:PIN domain-containing protein n=1 Tax=Rahnella sp. (strain Y9602) TaxID=2703885 RepID=UPI001C25FE7B|nr:PIN domain-containing protein [Rahnella aceris]MBU9841426.1 DNA-binding protein [Rahnella aceris]